jgi:hypothetical protein
MSRRQRQAAELRELCRAGDIGRAVDLAFGHFIDFGRDEEVLSLLQSALDATSAPPTIRRRFAELRDLPRA